MTIIGFNFTKINAERTKQAQGKINIDNNISIKEVEKVDLSLGSNKQYGIKFTFAFTTHYEPKVAEMNLEGEIYYTDTDKKINEVIDSWKKKKKVEEEFMGEILNTILNKCNIQALILSQEIGVPAPIPLPKLEAAPNKSGKEYIG